MKTLKITKGFRDKENDNQLITPPKTIERSNERAQELIDGGYAEDVTPEKKPAPKKKAAPKAEEKEAPKAEEKKEDKK